MQWMLYTLQVITIASSSKGMVVIYRTKGTTQQMLQKESKESIRTISTQKLGQFPGRGITSDTDKTLIYQNVPLFSGEIVVLPLAISSEGWLDLQSYRSLWSWFPNIVSVPVCGVTGGGAGGF